MFRPFVTAAIVLLALFAIATLVSPLVLDVSLSDGEVVGGVAILAMSAATVWVLWP